MLEEISITDLGVIASAQVTLGTGLTVVTGETGAGKTMVLTALDLLMGGKADVALVRSGVSTAAVEGRWLLPPDDPAAARAVDAGAAIDDDGALIVLRTLSRDDSGAGRSRAHLGGRAVPQAVLGELAESLVTVHGQSDQLRLRSQSRQREALDAMAQLGDTVAAHRALWDERQHLLADLSTIVSSATEREREAGDLRELLARVESVSPQPGEDKELTATISRLAHAEELRRLAALAHAAIGGDGELDEGGIGRVEAARRAMQQAAEHDSSAAAIEQVVAEAGYLLADAAGQLGSYLESIDGDPRGLDSAHERLAALTALTRLHGPDVDDLISWAEDARRRLLDLDTSDERADALRGRIAAVTERLDAVADQLTAARTTAAAALGRGVTEELAGLAMAKARLEVVVSPTQHGPTGRDEVAMLLSSHAGAPPRPLGKGASGGELSRVMLAIEVQLAAAGGAPATFVFDEVDAGVGGRAAIEVGRRLSRLAAENQVIVVTHLAQVAAFADTHVVVTKPLAEDGTVTASDVSVVTGEARLRELARMLSGHDDSDTARAHAAELLASVGVGR